MGSFNVGCGISNLSIHEGDRVGFQFIKPDETFLKGSGVTRASEGGITFQTYCTDLNKAFFPPVYGTYGDYGKIQNITPSITVDTLESIFRRPLEDIINILGRKRALYSSHGGLSELYVTPNNRLGDYQATEEEQFLSIGFTKQAENVYEYEGFTIRKDPKWKILDGNGNVIVNALWGSYVSDYVSIFAEKTGLYPGIAKEDWKAVKTIRQLSGMFFLEEVFHNMVTSLKPEWDSWGDPDEFKNDWESNQQLVKEYKALQKENPREAFAIIDVYSQLARSTAITVEHFSHLARFEDPAPFEEISNLYGVLTALNRMLVPSYNGEQFGNDDASQALNQVTNSILTARKKRYEDDDYEEDDE